VPSHGRPFSSIRSQPAPPRQTARHGIAGSGSAAAAGPCWATVASDELRESAAIAVTEVKAVDRSGEAEVGVD
jgi:hypothetical protein